MHFIRTAVAVLFSMCAGMAGAQPSDRVPGQASIQLNVNQLTFTPFSLAPDGGAASLTIAGQTIHGVATVSGPGGEDSQMFDNASSFGAARFWPDNTPKVDTGGSVNPLGTTFFIRDFTSPSHEWTFAESQFNTATTLHTSANTGVIISGHLTGSQYTTNQDGYSNTTFASFMATFGGEELSWQRSGDRNRRRAMSTSGSRLPPTTVATSRWIWSGPPKARSPRR